METKSKCINNLISLLLLILIFFSCRPSTSNNAIKEKPIDSVVNSGKSEVMSNTNSNSAEKCFFNNLSTQFDFQIVSIPQKENKVMIYKKSSNEILQSINSEYSLSDCIARSYITGFQKDNEIIDEDYGDLIVEDFNFDNLDDIAVKNDMGNSGAFYKFYLQSKESNFVLDKFLTEEVSHYPTFDKKKKAIKMANMVGASNIHERYYKYINNNWAVVLDTVVEINLQEDK